jgi:hypothetical protein
LNTSNPYKDWPRIGWWTSRWVATRQTYVTIFVTW